MYDLIIRNAKICDGTGDPAYVGAVAINGRKIVAVGEVDGEARETVDAQGMVLAPGFIDQHTHYDAQLLWDGLADPSLAHGVTTIMPGNCSLSLAPVKPEFREYLGETFRKIEEMPRPAMDAGVNWQWETFGEYLDQFRDKLGINVAPVVGHSPLRMWVMGLEARSREATDAEVRQMQDELRRILEAGAVAMSTSWVDIDSDNRPVPSRFANPRELEALCEVLSEYGATLQVLPEFFDSELLTARIDILADLSRRYGITTTFSPMFESNIKADLTDIALERLRVQAARGARVIPQMQVRAIDVAFELINPSSIMSAMPSWWNMMTIGEEETIRQLTDPARRKELVAEAHALDNSSSALEINFDEAIVKRVSLPEHQALIGRRLKDIAAERGTTSVDVMIDISLAENLRASFGMEGMGHNKPDKIGHFLSDPHISIGGGDGGAHLSRFATYGDTGFLFSRYVREGYMSLEKAVRKLTGDIAKMWRLKDRGLIRVGYAADLVLFDENTIDRGPEYAKYDLPGGEGFRYMRDAAGIAKVWVNGQLAYDGETGYTEARAGEITQGGAQQEVSAPAGSPPSVRSWTYPQASDSWEALAARTLPDVPTDEAISKLKSWNLYLAYRVAPAEITPTDILFTEAPVAA